MAGDRVVPNDKCQEYEINSKTQQTNSWCAAIKQGQALREEVAASESFGKAHRVQAVSLIQVLGC